MYKIYDLILEPLKKLNFKLQQDRSYRWYTHTNDYVTQGINTNEYLLEQLSKDEPFMLSRIGTSELHIILNYILRDQSLLLNIKQYIKGIQPEFWWGKYALSDLAVNSGFFPSDPFSLESFAELYLKELKNINVLLSWLKGEYFLEKNEFFNPHRINLNIFSAEPYFYDYPWTAALKNKKILVIHPFEKSIKHQYARRHLLFSNGTLPDFDLKTIKAVQSIKGNKTIFKSYFHALDHMKSEIDSIDFDIALIGAGA